MQAVCDAIQPNTRMIFCETPVNPHLTVYDLQAIAEIAQQYQLISVVDNTFMTPLLQQPINFGIDIVVHSATKFLNGHGDVIAGIVCGDCSHLEPIRMHSLKDIGAVISPHDAWLILRGMKTLDVRMQRHCQNAQLIAEYLEQHPQVEQVFYPGLETDAGYRFIGQQMVAAGGLVAFTLKADLSQCQAFINRLQLFSIAVSLGDAESLIQHPASMTHSPYTPEMRLQAGITDNLIRISAGLEDAEDIIADLAQALAQVN